MLNKKEYLFMLKSFILSLLIIWGFFKYMTMKITIMQVIFLSIYTMGVLKTIYDILYQTGYKKVYKYSDSTNQYLRYATFIIAFIFWVFIFYGFIFLRHMP